MSNVDDWELWVRDENGEWARSESKAYIQVLHDRGVLDEVMEAWADESSPVTPEVADERLAKYEVGDYDGSYMLIEEARRVRSGAERYFNGRLEDPEYRQAYDNAIKGIEAELETAERLAKWADEDEAARWGVKLEDWQRKIVDALTRESQELGLYDSEYVSRRQNVYFGFGGKSEFGGVTRDETLE